MDSLPSRANRTFYLGLFLISMCAVMFELLLTRIFSVTTWYHFAFLAISLAMLGMSVGAIYVYLRPKIFTADKTYEHCSKAALLCAGFSLLAILVHIKLPMFLDLGATPTIIVSLLSAAPLLLAAFAANGVCISLALTRFPTQVNRLYAADLVGAAFGGPAVVGLLQFFDGISAALFVSALMLLSASAFALSANRRLSIRSAAAAIGLIIFSAFNAFGPQPLVALSWTKGQIDDPVLWQKWNSFSRLRVMGDPNVEHSPTGFYGKAQGTYSVRELLLDIDGCAQTTLTFFDGNAVRAEHLKHDIGSIVHYVRPESNVLVIGMGGGRDVLAALVMGQRSVTGVEINPDIIKADCSVFGDFTGHLDRDPRVRIVNQEGRSFVSHHPEKYDIICASVVDTWAASASGAYALSENSLYTVDCWVEFLNHLTPRGVLAMTRFYNTDEPAEFYRLTSLAVESLKKIGVEHPRQHLCAVKFPERGHAGNIKLATLLVSRSPFSAGDLDVLERTCEQLGYDVLLSPRVDQDKQLALIAGGDDLGSIEALPWNIKAPTDDSPFFFQVFKPTAMIKPASSISVAGGGQLVGALLLFASAVTALLSLGCFIRPLIKLPEKSTAGATAALLGYFFMIGLGFMFIEVSQIQRFTIFLGHPTYGATVALTTLLLATGCGSFFLKEWLERHGAERFLPVVVLLPLLLLAVFGASVLNPVRHVDLGMRILWTVLILFPVGFVLGILFPFGMKLANANARELTPWLWAMNGLASVLGSLLTIIVSIACGINASLLMGVACYAVAGCLFILLGKTRVSAA